MIVVADTSPINYIVQLGLLNEFQTIYGKVILPRAVFEELRHPSAPGPVRAWATRLPEWVEVKEPRLSDLKLPPNLGIGESEAINLAVELNADLLLIDDLPGRKAAHEHGIPLTGTLTIVWQAAIISSFDFEYALAELRRLGFRVSDEVLINIRDAYRANRGPHSP
jgi:predicted nucleic acid-binding protein